MLFLPISISQNAQIRGGNMGGSDYVTKHRNIYTRQQAIRLGYGGDVSSGGIRRYGIQRTAYLEKYQITDIVNGIKVTRTKFRLRKRRKKRS